MNEAYEKIKNRLLEYKKKNYIVPTEKMIKTKEQIEEIKAAGVINTAILDMVEENIKAGMSTEDINKLVHNFTISHGAIPAPLNYEGFPKSVRSEEHTSELQSLMATLFPYTTLFRSFSRH